MMGPKQYTSISTDVLTPRLPELGKIRIGMKGKEVKTKKGATFRLPKKIDYFRVVTRRKDDTDNWILDDRVHDKVGPEPTELDVRLLFDAPDENFQFFLAAYTGPGQCRCKGDGETAWDSELEQEIPCPCPMLKQFEGQYDGPKRPAKVACKPYGRLSVALEAAESFGGFYVFRTTSWETISNLASQLNVFRAQFGFLAGLPLKLVIYPAQVQYDDGGNVKTGEAYKVALVLRASYMEALKLASAAHEQRTRLALPAGADVARAHQERLAAAEEEEAEEISGEFYPEAHAGDETDYTIVDDAEGRGEALLEDLCVATLEIAAWEQIQITKQIAKYEGRLAELLPVLWENMPAEVEKAATDLAQKAIDDGEKELGGAYLETLAELKDDGDDAAEEAGEDSGDEDEGADEEVEDTSEAEEEDADLELF